MSNVDEISVSALKVELSKDNNLAAIKALDLVDISKNPRVADTDSLRVGDIILSKKRQPLDPVGITQLFNGTIDMAHAKWTHAMIYVGNFHIAESVPRAGTRIAALTSLEGHDKFMVCRYRGPDLDDDIDGDEISTDSINFKYYRQRAGRHAAVTCQAAWRPYSYKRAIGGNAALNELFKKKPPVEEAVICTEFVLEALAVGGLILPEEWRRIADRVIKADGKDFYFPANFMDKQKFHTEPMPTIKLVA